MPYRQIQEAIRVSAGLCLGGITPYNLTLHFPGLAPDSSPDMHHSPPTTPDPHPSRDPDSSRNLKAIRMGLPVIPGNLDWIHQASPNCSPNPSPNPNSSTLTVALTVAL